MPFYTDCIIIVMREEEKTMRVLVVTLVVVGLVIAVFFLVHDCRSARTEDPVTTLADVTEDGVRTSAEEEFRSRIESAYRTQNKEMLQNLYHLESLNKESLDFLSNRIDALFKRETDWKRINVKLSPVIHTASINYGSFNGRLIYPSIRPTGGTACIHYYRPKGRSVAMIPFAKEGDRYYLVTKNMTDLATEESDIYTLQFLVVNGYKIKNLPPITLTVKESGVVNVYNIPFGSRGGFKASQVLSFSCPPVPTEEKVHIRIYNTKDESHVILDQEFDGQKGIFWTAGEVKQQLEHITKE